MIDLNLLQPVSWVAAAIGVCVAAVYYVLNIRISLRNQELTLKALEQSAQAQELSLKTQQQNLETRQAQLFMQLFDRWSGSEFALKYGKAAYEIYPKCNNSPEELNVFLHQKINEHFDPEVFAIYQQLTIFFDGVGVLVRKGLVDIDLVERIFYDRIIWYWEMIKPRALFVRESFGPKHLEDLEWLYEEMVRRHGNAVH